MHHEVWFAEGGAGDHENRVISSRLLGFAEESSETTAMKVWQCLPAMSSRMTLVFEQSGRRTSGTMRRRRSATCRRPANARVPR